MDTHSAASSDTARIVAVVGATVLAIVGSFVGSGVVVGTPVAEAAGGALAPGATAVAPASPAFSIWSVVYVGFVAYAIWQALPAQRANERQRRAGWWIALAMILNAAWILSIQFDLLWVSVLVILALLATLVVIFRSFVSNPPASTVEAVVADGTMFLYLGWVCVAVVANIAAALASEGIDPFGLGATTWAIVVLVVVGVVSVVLATAGHGRLAPAVAIAWGLVWIAVARSDEATAPSTAVAVTSAVVAAVALLAAVSVRVLERGRAA